MKHPFIDHSFTKISEVTHEPSFAKVFVEAKLKQLEDVANIIRQNHDNDAVESVLRYSLTHRALSQCLEYINNQNSNLTNDDYFIFYEFLYNQLKESEKIIDKELDQLGL